MCRLQSNRWCIIKALIELPLSFDFTFCVEIWINIYLKYIFFGKFYYSIALEKFVSLYSLKNKISYCTFWMATPITTSFASSCLLTKLTLDNMSYQMTIATMNLKLPSLLSVKDLDSLLVNVSSSLSATCNKASLIFWIWNLIAFTLSTRLSQRVVDNGLRVNPY